VDPGLEELLVADSRGLGDRLDDLLGLGDLAADLAADL